jgi:hypothetical protein
MITFSKIGEYGRLGNQLFQIAAAFSHAKKNNLDFCLPHWEYNQYLKTPIKSCQNIQEFLQHRERDAFKYTEIPNHDNLDLFGYFQNEKYFYEYRDDIINLISPSDDILQKIHDQIYDLRLFRTTAIHVRRGDYLSLQDHHPIPTMEYYNNAIKILDKETDKYLVFSDDIDWCKENFPSHFIFSEEKDEFIDLIKMSKCWNFIIANSSFSWWGSYLGEYESKTIAPSKWLGINYSGKNWDGLYRKNMIVI